MFLINKCLYIMTINRVLTLMLDALLIISLVSNLLSKCIVINVDIIAYILI